MSVTDTATDKSKKCKSPGAVRIAAEITQALRETLYSEIHNLINYIKVFYLPTDAQ